MNETTVKSSTPGEVKAVLSENKACQLVDVRTPLEFESEHIENSFNIPLDELGKRASELKKDSEIILICRSGNRAGRASQVLSAHQYQTVVMEGGIESWKKEKLPLVEGKKVISLERQVQLTIGLILLASVTAGFLVNKWFFILPAIIGAGLTFAGLTGTCGLALLIAKAPWNQIPSAEKSGCCSHK